MADTSSQRLPGTAWISVDRDARQKLMRAINEFALSQGEHFKSQLDFMYYLRDMGFLAIADSATWPSCGRSSRIPKRRQTMVGSRFKQVTAAHAVSFVGRLGGALHHPTEADPSELDVVVQCSIL